MRIGNKVFISYSEEDREWLKKLQQMFATLQQQRKISVWDNTKIKAGDITEEAIKNALAEAKIAVLLVSANFLASDDILKQQLLPLLKAAEQEGLKIIWICVSACVYEITPINNYTAAHDITKPLNSLSEAELDSVLKDIASKIQEEADYLKKLREYLETKNWKKANQETTKLMLEAAKKEQKGWLTKEDIEKIDCDFLEEIDKLWIQHSNGNLGFSVQKKIWNKVDQNCNGDYKKAEEEFGIHKVRWCQRYQRGLTCLRSELKFTQANINIKGYLPTPPPMTRDENEIKVEAIAAIAKKLEKCK